MDPSQCPLAFIVGYSAQFRRYENSLDMSNALSSHRPRFHAVRREGKACLEMCSSDSEKSAPVSGDYADSARDRDNDDGEVSLEDVEGLLENSNVRPRFDFDADERVMIHQLRKKLHKNDFDRIFNSKDRRIGEII